MPVFDGFKKLIKQSTKMAAGSVAVAASNDVLGHRLHKKEDYADTDETYSPVPSSSASPSASSSTKSVSKETISVAVNIKRAQDPVEPMSSLGSSSERRISPSSHSPGPEYLFNNSISPSASPATTITTTTADVRSTTAPPTGVSAELLADMKASIEKSEERARKQETSQSTSIFNFRSTSPNSAGSKGSSSRHLRSKSEHDRLMRSKYEGLDRYEFLEKLGDGAFSDVYKARDKETQTLVAVKIVRKHELNANQRANVLKEVQIMRGLRHPAILQLISFSESKDYYHLVLEYVEGGELFHQIVKLTYFSEDLTRHVVVQVAEGIRYLHQSVGVVHRDIKPENILFHSIPFIPDPQELIEIQKQPHHPDEDPKEPEGVFTKGIGGGEIGRIKIADFGLSKVIWDTTTQTPCGTVGYTAPEIVRDEDYSKSVDMWALGCVLYTCLCGFPPFYDESVEHLTQKVAKGEFEFLSPWWDDVSAGAKDLVSRLLCIDPLKRMTVDEVFEHPWIRQAGPESPTSSLDDLIDTHLRLSKDDVTLIPRGTFERTASNPLPDFLSLSASTTEASSTASTPSINHTPHYSGYGFTPEQRMSDPSPGRHLHNQLEQTHTTRFTKRTPPIHIPHQKTPRASDGKSPGLKILKNIFDISYAVQRQEEEKEEERRREESGKGGSLARFRARVEMSAIGGSLFSGLSSGDSGQEDNAASNRTSTTAIPEGTPKKMNFDTDSDLVSDDEEAIQFAESGVRVERAQVLDATLATLTANERSEGADVSEEKPSLASKLVKTVLHHNHKEGSGSRTNPVVRSQSTRVRGPASRQRQGDQRGHGRSGETSLLSQTEDRPAQGQTSQSNMNFLESDPKAHSIKTTHRKSRSDTTGLIGHRVFELDIASSTLLERRKTRGSDRADSAATQPQPQP
ncbi:hypothetical protein BZG36_00102 [Bifiguratus adelaidae]|uniref:Protein kinase domain-containing protein n=1 Tax=Bifiguratus adelaidae TaxID=1938954 RepID=A0A261Y839_9FUNG|nr:hypothetical protein BZG36_00102 [Bifiguratus adelaidae]